MIFFTITGIIVWGCVVILAIWYATGRIEFSMGREEDFKDD